MKTSVFFHRAGPLEAGLHHASIERLFADVRPLPNGNGHASILAVDAFGQLVGASEMSFSKGSAHVRFAACPLYQDSDVEESLLARSMLAARNLGAAKIAFDLQKEDESRALLARSNGMSINRSGETWVAEAYLPYADPCSFAIECALSWFVPVPAECR